MTTFDLSRLVARRRPWRIPVRIGVDPVGELSIALAILAIGLVVVGPRPGEIGRATLVSIAFVSIEIPLATILGARLGRGRRWFRTLRMLLILAYVTVLGILIDPDGLLPMSILAVPVVAMAAATGGFEAILVGSVGLAAFLAPELVRPTVGSLIWERAWTLAGVTLVLAIGTRRTIGQLRLAVTRLRQAVGADRRRARHMAGVEQVSEILAREGPTQAVLDGIMAVLVDRFGYHHPSIYQREGDAFILLAQRGYTDPIETFDGTSGVVGRVIRTRKLAFVPDVTRDPDYRSADPLVRSEISVPLLDRDELLGIFNVESTAERPLDEADLGMVVAIADRLASAIALARERQALADHVAALQRLGRVTSTVNRAVEPDDLFRTIVGTISDVVPADLVGLTVLDRSTGRYVVRAAFGSSDATGAEIAPGEGMAGRAIRDRAIVRSDDYDRAAFPAALRETPGVSHYALALGIPLVRDDVAVGALTLARTIGPPISSLELEILDLLAGQTALAISNAFLHADAAALAVRDALTGLFNRRHFDAALEQILRLRDRRPVDDREPIGAIMFDLDHFGEVNKAHGHQVGDGVLRRFAEVLRERLRGSDLVARYGGEEFVAILPGAGRDEAVVVAEEIRLAFAGLAPDAAGLRPTVSAGVSVLSGDSGSAEELLRAADVGLFMAKRAGRNQVVAA